MLERYYGDSYNAKIATLLKTLLLNRKSRPDWHLISHTQDFYHLTMWKLVSKIVLVIYSLPSNSGLVEKKDNSDHYYNTI